MQPVYTFYNFLDVNINENLPIWIYYIDMTSKVASFSLTIPVIVKNNDNTSFIGLIIKLINLYLII